jgi:hypothetical protein
MSSRSLAWILIVLAMGEACGRILSAHLVYEPNVHRTSTDKPEKGRAWPSERPRPMPTFGSNDRSRWATIHALVDKGTYVVGRRDKQTLFKTVALNFAAENGLQAATIAQAGYYLRTRTDEETGNNIGIIFDDGWGTVDRVMNPETMEFYSSKPPLLARLLAGLYWLLQRLTEALTGQAWTLSSQPAAVVRTILLVVNALPFLLYLYVLARIGLRYASTEWSRMVILGAAAFGTMVTPFLVTLNNHTLGTFCVLWALASVLSLWEHGSDHPSQPLPGLHFVSAGLLAAFAVCNELPALAFWAGIGGLLFLWSPWRTLLLYVPASLLVAAAFFWTNYEALGQLAPAYSEFGGPWYEYEGSHWRKPEDWEIKHGIDWARLKETKGEYALHLLIGHHGFFSLTPLWLIALFGLFWLLANRRGEGDLATGRLHEYDTESPRPLPGWLPLFTLGLTLVVVGFYVFKSDNYGGWTNGPRWLMWLSPLLLICLYPVLDKLGECPWGRGLTYVCLGLSVLSVHYRLWNPWRHPWIYDLMVWLGWPGY